MLLTFGRHAGEHIENVVHTDAKYARWLYSYLLDKEDSPLKQKLEHIIGTGGLRLTIVDFGKYTSMNVYDILKIDRTYAIYLHNHPMVKENAKYIWRILDTELT